MMAESRTVLGMHAHDDTKSSVESEVMQSWVVCSLGGDESAAAGAGPPGVSTEGSTQEQGSQDTELLMKQNTFNPRLFLAVWQVVNWRIREGLEAEALACVGTGHSSTALGSELG